MIWKFCHEASAAWLYKRAGIAEEANRKRSDKQKGVPKAEAKERARTDCPRRSTEPERKAKAALSQTNPGAVARGDKLTKARPDLAEKVRLGEMSPADAHREMKREEIVASLESVATKEVAKVKGKPTEGR